MVAFYTIQSLGSIFLASYTVEYHIHYDTNEDFEAAFEGNTSKSFRQAIYDFLITEFADELKKHGQDESYTEDGVDRYIWVHLDEFQGDTITDRMILALTNKYDTEWSKYRVPKLLTILKRRLGGKRYLATAICNYQLRHGFEATENALHVFFNDID